MLLPAIRRKAHVTVGNASDSHATILAKHGLSDGEHGFSTDGQVFLNRIQALHWIQEHEPKTFRKLPIEAKNGLHSHMLAQARGIRQEQIEVTDFSTKKVLVWDKGLYLHAAQKLGETFGKVYYCVPSGKPYPESPLAQIGKGFPEIERVTSFWDKLEEVDMVAFFDCYEGDLQHWLDSKGYSVFGAMKSEKFELDKVFFLEQLKRFKLPIAHTCVTKGLDDLCSYLEEGKGTRWLKTSYHRGDFETHKYKNMRQFQPWLTDLKSRIGKRADNIEVLVQDSIESVCEIGYDGFCLDGEFATNCLCGYEVKDKGYVGRVFKETPEVLKQVNEACAPVFRELGYQGACSTELRITAKGIPYFIDPTQRLPSPPSELMVEIYSNFDEIVWELAHGRMPAIKPKAKYGAEVILTSPWHDTHELVVEFPKKVAANVKLKNAMKDGGIYRCIPNGNGGFFGAVVAYGDTLKAATDQVLEIVKEIECEELDFEESVFDQVQEALESGEQFGVHF